MKKLITLAILGMTVLGLIAAPVMAAEFMLNAKVQSVTLSKDTNGAEYARLIGNEKRALNGVEYEVALPAMAFKDLVKEARKIKAGDTIKAICQKRLYQGRESFTIVKFVK